MLLTRRLTGAGATTIVAGGAVKWNSTDTDCAAATSPADRMLGIYIGGADVSNPAGTSPDIDVCIFGLCYARAGASLGRGMLLTIDSASRVIPIANAATNNEIGLIGQAMQSFNTDAFGEIFVYSRQLLQLRWADTQTNLRAIGNAINTTNKYAGKQVFDTTNNKPVWAVGSTAGSVWVDGAGTTVHTPV